MPALSPTMDKGKIVKWNIQEGGKIEVGDLICEIQTDKATVGFESQDEGYLAKIYQPEGSEMEVGGLIGLMVEEEDDIKNIDYASITAGSSAEATPSSTPAAVEQPKAAASTAAVASSPGSESFFDELEHMIHGGDYRVAPAAGWWMRTYHILPSEVKPTGPKGFILKGDVLEHIEKNNIQKGVRVSAVATKTAPSAAPVAPKKPAAAAKKPMAGANAQSPAKDAANPF